MPDYEKALQRVMSKVGGESALARALGITVPSVRDWRRIPAHRILQVEKVTGIPRERLRPDLYRRRQRT